MSKEFRPGTRIVCDNGQVYRLGLNNDNNGIHYTFSIIDDNGMIVNLAMDYHLEDCYYGNKLLCVGEDNLGELVYTKILDVKE